MDHLYRHGIIVTYLSHNSTILTSIVSVHRVHNCRYGTDEAAIYSGKTDSLKKPLHNFFCLDLTFNGLFLNNPITLIFITNSHFYQQRISLLSH